MNKQTYCIGDIHGEAEKLQKCLDSVNFDYENDQLITLGDIVDRGPDSYQCIEILKKIKNRIDIQGNHDECWYNALLKNEQTVLWKFGGIETAKSYINRGLNPSVHIDFFKKQRLYYVDENNNCFVHAGFNRHYLINHQPDPIVYNWDRDFFNSAMGYSLIKKSTQEQFPFKTKNNFNKIFIGHTPTLDFDVTEPIKISNIWNLDTGAGKYKEGRVTIMNIKTEEYKQF